MLAHASIQHFGETFKSSEAHRGLELLQGEWKARRHDEMKLLNGNQVIIASVVVEDSMEAGRH